MKVKLTAIVFVLFLTTFSAAQAVSSSKADPSQASTIAAPAATKPDCSSCCKKMADGNAAESCCAHHQEGSAKAEMSCCNGKEGKDAMSCMKGDKDKSASTSAANGKCCAGHGKEACCSKSDKTTEQAAMTCCGANGEQCGMAHDAHADISKLRENKNLGTWRRGFLLAMSYGL